MRMRNAALTLVLLLAAVLRSSASPDTAFEQAVSVEDVLINARENAGKAQGSPSSLSTTIRYERDCARFDFEPASPLTSERAALYSREWIKECRVDQDGKEECVERPGQTFRDTAQITLQNRGSLLPWETEAFSICLEGPDLSLDAVSLAYRYKVIRGGRRIGEYVLEAGEKVKTASDERGLDVAEWPASLVMKLQDKWAPYYAGETVAIRIVFMREGGFLGLGQHLYTKTYTFPTAETYTIDLKKDAKPKDIRPGTKYWAGVYFTRVSSKISTSDTHFRGDVKKIRYQPAPAPLPVPTT